MCTQSCQTLVIPWTPTLATPWTVAHQALLSMGFSRPEYWIELAVPLPWDFPTLGMEPITLLSPALAGRFFKHYTTWEALRQCCLHVVFSCSVMSDFLRPHDCSMQIFPVLHHLLELAQIHVC